ncbi:hypothetical protein [Clostridium sp. DL1XJH146]
MNGVGDDKYNIKLDFKIKENEDLIQITKFIMKSMHSTVRFVKRALWTCPSALIHDEDGEIIV